MANNIIICMGRVFLWPIRQTSILNCLSANENIPPGEDGYIRYVHQINDEVGYFRRGSPKDEAMNDNSTLSFTVTHREVHRNQTQNKKKNVLTKYSLLMMVEETQPRTIMEIWVFGLMPK